jgi:RNA polymerase sigma-70 factor (ECF subfamily)
MPSDARPPDRDPAPGGADARRDPDVELLRRTRAGEAPAFAELVERHQDAIYGLIFRMVGEATTAEELTQDTFLRAWHKGESFRGESKVSTWLYRIAVNLCRDHRESRRARQTRLETSLDDPARGPMDLVARGMRPDERLQEREIAGAFQRALDELDADHRAAFLLRHQEGLGPAEIAAVLGISAANAKVRVHRARQRILSTLRRLGHVK